MQTIYERSSERSSHDYARIDDAADSPGQSGLTYRSAMSPRVITVQRNRSSGVGGGVMTRVFQSIQSTGGSANFGSGLAALTNYPGIPLRGAGPNSSAALVGINQVRQRDKRQLEQLNDKFAQYVEKVRFLEAQNRKLLMELEALKGRAGQGSSRIKEMYEIETGEAHKLIDDTKRDAAAANVKTQQAEQEVKRQRARYNEVSSAQDADKRGVEALQKQLADNQAQINLFRRRMDDLEEESRRHKSQAQRLATEIGRLQHEIQSESFLKSSCEVEKIALEDELATLKQMHEADLAELRARTVSNDLDPSQFFRNELAQAIREIRNDYENRVDGQRNDLQSRYSMLFNELTIRQQRNDADPIQNAQQRRQVERLRQEVSQTQNQSGYLRAQNEDLKNRIQELDRQLNALKEKGSAQLTRTAKEIEDARRALEKADRDYKDVTNMKTSLEKEISTYRDLLESQNGLRGYVDRIVQNVQQQAIDQSTPRPNVLTSITRTILSTTGNTSGGLSSLAGQSPRPGNSTYQTLSSGFGSSVRDSFGSDSSPRRSGDF